MTSVLNLTSTGYEKVTQNDGTEEWLLNGKLHRENDLPTIVFFDRSQYWYQNGKLHR